MSIEALPPLSGIYAIEHLPSGTKYIGASTHIHQRWLRISNAYVLVSIAATDSKRPGTWTDTR